MEGPHGRQLKIRSPSHWQREVDSEQSDDGISLHLDTHIKELVEEYKDIHKKFIEPKSVPMSPGVVLDKQGRLSRTSRPHQAEALPLDGGQGPVCSILDPIRYFVTSLHSWPDSALRLDRRIGQLSRI
jgi:hypothetical protein